MDLELSIVSTGRRPGGSPVPAAGPPPSDREPDHESGHEPRATATPGSREEPAMRTLLARRFTADEVATLRCDVARHATRCGLSGRRLDDFVLAVHESVINAANHAGGGGRLKLWTADGLLCAETVDRGSGIPRGHLDGHHLPGETAYDGRGIFLIRELCDGVVFSTGPQGTRVEMTMRLPRSRRPLSPMRRVRVAVTRPARHPGGFIA